VAIALLGVVVAGSIAASWWWGFQQSRGPDQGHDWLKEIVCMYYFPWYFAIEHPIGEGTQSVWLLPPGGNNRHRIAQEKKLLHLLCSRRPHPKILSNILQFFVCECRELGAFAWWRKWKMKKESKKYEKGYIKMKKVKKKRYKKKNNG